jgi:hypothetical protein
MTRQPTAHRLVAFVLQRFPNFFQVGTTLISQNVLRTTLLLSPLKANCLRFSTTMCNTQFTLILFFCLFWTNVLSKRTTRAEPEDHLWSVDHSLGNAALRHLVAPAYIRYRFTYPKFRTEFLKRSFFHTFLRVGSCSMFNYYRHTLLLLLLSPSAYLSRIHRSRRLIVQPKTLHSTQIQ